MLFVLSLGYLSQLDERAKIVSAAAYADSTLSTRRSQWHVYLRFCSSYGLVPIPAQPQTIVRFLIHLSTYCKYCSIINYLSAINVLHRHFGHSVTFQDVFTIKLVTRGLRRILGDAQEQKLPITPDILKRIHPLLSTDMDSGYWAAILIGFNTFFRKSNLVPKSAQSYDSSKHLSHSDFFICPWGLVICVRWSKTIQFKQRRLLIPVVRLPPGHPLCAVQAYEHHLHCHPAPSSSPAFLKSSDGEIKPITYDALGTKLRSVLASVGLDPSKYSTHSLRRGGASYAFKCGAPVELISLQGDWSSDAVLLYIAQPLERRLSVARLIASNITCLPS